MTEPRFTVPAPAFDADADAARMTMKAPSLPRVSIVIPVYNEEAILHAAVVDLVDLLQDKPWNYEILLAENGSTDATVKIANELAEKYEQLRVISIGEPNYGKALREGILAAAGDIVICEEIDLCDVDFHQRAITLLQKRDAELVIGSKLLEGANDERPWLRHAGSVVINGMLRVTLGFKGTDTHGLKAFRREKLLAVVQACVVDKDLFASEFVIRAERAGVPIQEIPVRVLEKRPPSIHLFRRVPNVLRNLGKLVVAIRINK